MSTVASADRNLDVLRAVAVLCVLVDHIITSQIGAAPWLWTLGRCGVLLFFVHTSYVLMASLDRSPVEHRTSAFYLRRAFRIYPLAIVVIAITAIAALPSNADLLAHPGGIPLTPIGVVSNLLLIENLNGQRDIVGVMWSLPLELQMYVVLPLCFVIARRSVRWTAALWAGAVGLGLWQLHTHAPGAWRLNVLAFGPCFAAGVLAWSVRRRRPSTRVLPAWCWLPLLLGALCLTPLLHADAVRVERGWPICVAVGLLVIGVRELDASWLTRGAHVIAEYSYGIYLLHTAAITVAFLWARALSRAEQWALFAALMIGLPFVAYHVIEKPGIAAGKQLASRWAEGRARRLSQVAVGSVT